jgi:hypothetical protein
MVVLERLPPGLLNGLPEEDQIAISEMVEKPVLLAGYDDVGRAELEFSDRNGHSHSIFVDPSFIRTKPLAQT